MTRPSLPRIIGLGLGLGLVLLAAAGCSDHEFHPPSEEQRISQADSLFTPALFDSIDWASNSERIDTGNLVYADECRRCHGPLGRGDEEYAEAHDLDVPSLVRSDWPFGEDMDSLRHQIFVGHGGGMPAWGSGRLSPRQIDAAAAYLVFQLRPEVLGSDTP